MINEKKLVKKWKYRSYNHMRKFKHIKNILSTTFKWKILFEEDNNLYLKYRIYRKNRMSSIKIDEIINEAIKKIESLTIQLKEYLNQTRSIDAKEKLKSVNNFAKKLTRLINAIIIIMSKFAKKSNDWKH
jgi:hypothetical protein